MSSSAILTPDAVKRLLSELPKLPAAEKLALLDELDAFEHRKQVQACRDDFLVFCRQLYPQWKEGPHHRYLKPILHEVRDGTETRLTVSLPPRFGKALALDTEIPTPDRGFVRMGNLRVGDTVFAVDGTPTQIVSVSPVWRDRPVCRVTTNDGYSVVADNAHEWNVIKDRKRPQWTTVDTAYVLKRTKHSKEARALRIPLQGAVQYPEQVLPIHPYVLGVWLGDGRSDHSALCTADDFIFDKINAIEGPEFTEYEKVGVTRHWRPGPVGSRGDTKSLQARLRKLGVLNNKHIPDIYLRASAQQRLELLQGLIDTDGGVAKLGCVTFNNTNERLARQVQELVQSLGTKASLTVGPAKLDGVQYGHCWKVHFFHSQAATLPRKAERCRAAQRTTERYIRAEEGGVADTVCIEIAHPSHLFLCTRGYIPTHNSETIAYMFVAWYLGHLPNHHIMMATHTAALSADFGRKVRNLLDTPAYQEIFPDTCVSKDKSASDNWTTTSGGKYLAIGIGANVAGHGAHLLIADDLCVHITTLVHTPQGCVQAGTVDVGDYLLGEAGWQQVIRKTTSTHATSVRLDGVWLSDKHPVWTFDAGWVRAGRLQPGALLRTTSVYGKIKSSVKRGLQRVKTSKTVRGVQTRVQHLGDDEATVPKPEGGKLQRLWGQGDHRCAGVRDVFGVPAAAGTGTNAKTHAGQDRQHAGVHATELPLGRCGDAAEQSDEWCALRVSGEDAVRAAVGTTGGYTHGTAGAPVESLEDVAARGDGITEAELGAAPRKADDFGWAAGAAVRLFGVSRKIRAVAELAANHPSQRRGGVQYIATGARWLQKVAAWGVEKLASGVGVFVGVRRLGRVEHVSGTDEFVNFEVRGDNTFFADDMLTHNCSEQAILANPDASFETAWTYMQVGPLQRLMPGGRIIMIGTRWGRRDPIGRALSWAEQNPGSVPWREIRFPAIMPSGKSLWPEQWPIEQMLAKKAGMQPQYWAAQYMQEPTSEEGAILKRDWWKIWEKETPPVCEFIMQVWDTAHDTKSMNDYSACVTMGIWFNEETNRHELILLNAIKDRWEFPQLKQKALEHYKEWEPDCLLIEKKAAGAPLIQELRQMDMYVEEYSPSRGTATVSNDKRARVNAVSPMLFDGVAWAPDRRWAHELINECAEFPNGEHDDYVDCVAMALARFRNGGFVSLSSDRKDEPYAVAPRRAAYY